MDQPCGNYTIKEKVYTLYIYYKKFTIRNIWTCLKTDYFCFNWRNFAKVYFSKNNVYKII